jgi:voltage-gated potassium channel
MAASQREPGLAGRPRLERFVQRLTLGRAVAAVVIVAVALTLLGAGLLRIFNSDAFATYGDACWLSVITVTTVGFGDVLPTNTAGRWITAALALLGISLIPVLTSLVISILLTERSVRDSDLRAREQEELLQRLERIEQQLERRENG